MKTRAWEPEFTKAIEADLKEMGAAGLAEFRTDGEERDAEDVDFWHWRYFKQAAVKSDLLFARRGGRVVGKVGLIGRRLHSAGRRLTATYMEGLSLPAAQRSWSLLAGLLEASFRERRRSNRPFAFGVAARSAAELFKRLGCRVLGRLPLLSVVLNGRRLLRRKGIPSPLSSAGWAAEAFLGARYGGECRSVSLGFHAEKFDGSFGELWRGLEPKRCVAVVKDAPYLNWRYKRFPGREYQVLTARRDRRLEGWTVFRTGGMGDGFVLDLVARDDAPDILRALLRQALIRMRSKGAAVATASCLDNAPARPAYRSAGFKPWPGIASSTWMIMETPPAGKHGPETELSNWDFSLGDWLIH